VSQGEHVMQAWFFWVELDSPLKLSDCCVKLHRGYAVPRLAWASMKTWVGFRRLPEGLYGTIKVA